MKPYLFIVVFTFYHATSFSQAGSLDLSFGNNGIARYEIGPSGSRTAGLCEQSDGKIVILTSVGIARFNTDGTIDSSFGSNGLAPVNLFNYFGVDYPPTVKPIAIQSDDKIIVSGSLNTEITVERFTSNGILDSTFGNYGLIQIEHTSNSYSNGLIQYHGKIIIAGTTLYIGPVVFRLNIDGSFDHSFGHNGRMKVAHEPLIWINALTVDSNSNIVIGGYQGYDSSAIVKIKWNGDLDSSFAVNGIWSKRFGEVQDFIYDLKVQQDNKIIAAGWYYYSYPYNLSFTVLRLNTDGTLDSTFGINGVAFSSSLGMTVNSIIIQPDKKIVLVGYGGYTYYDDQVIIARIDSTGNFDSGFGSNGIVETALFSPGWIAYNVAGCEQGDGKIVATVVTNGESLYADSIILLRYNGNDIASGYTQVNNKQSYFIYPNPVYDFFELPLNMSGQKTEVTIYDLAGRRIDLPLVTTNSVLKIDARTLNDGFYLLEVFKPETQSKFSLKFTKAGGL